MPGTHHAIFVHVVFSTKQRFSLLHESWRDDLYAVMGGIARENDATLIKSGGIEDHVHLLLRIHPKRPLSEIVQRIKANSSNWINNLHKISAKFSWQRGYGAFSVSQSMLKKVVSYVENQVVHHRKQSFKEEYLVLLQKHEIDFDERYVFDDEVVG